jgi:transcriptional regulator with XRE-family HTH domain
MVMEKNFDVEKRFGAKLAYVRKSRKFSQIKLAELVDMNFNYIGQIERGEANVTIKTMRILANALDVELKELFDFSF